MTLNQMSMTKPKSRYKHEKCRKRCVLRAYAGLYFERLSYYFKLGVNEHVIRNFHDFSKNFYDLSFFHDFSRPGNDHFKIPGLFQVFHDRTNPAEVNTHLLLSDRRVVQSRGLCGWLRLSLGAGFHWGAVLSSLSQRGEKPGPL